MAVQRALEMDAAQLVFLYIVDVQGLAHDEISLKKSLSAELHWVGQVLLSLAQQRAAAAGISAEIVVIEGGVQSQIRAFLRDQHANLLLVGAPRGTTANIFGDDEVEKFAIGVQNDTGVKVEIVRPEDVS